MIAFSGCLFRVAFSWRMMHNIICKERFAEELDWKRRNIWEHTAIERR